MARPKKTYHHGDLRRTLMTASVALIEKVGIEALSLREVAREAKVSPAAPYHHFPSKMALLGAIATEGFEGLGNALREAVELLPNPDDPLPRLAALGVAYIDFARSHPTEFRMMFRGAATTTMPEASADPGSAFALLLDAVGRVTRLMPKGMIAPEALTLTCWSVVHGAAQLAIDGVLSDQSHPMPIRADQAGAMAVTTLMKLLGAAVTSRA
jgi:AcrR family transcriptional regulator